MMITVNNNGKEGGGNSRWWWWFTVVARTGGYGGSWRLTSSRMVLTITIYRLGKEISSQESYSGDRPKSASVFGRKIRRYRRVR